MAVGVIYNLYICDISYNKLAKVDYVFLQYSQVINAIPQAYFVVQTQSPQLANIGFNFNARGYTCIIERGTTEVFRGEIDLMSTPGNTTPLGVNQNEAYGTLDRIGFNASSVIGRLKDLIAAPDTGSLVYKRSFNNQTLGQAFTTLINEAKNRAPTNVNPVASLTVGTVENPVDKNGNAITLTTSQALYGASYLEWMKILGDIGNADWYIRNGTVIDFVKYRSTNRAGEVIFKLKKGDTNNSLTGVTFNIDRQKMVNKVIVVGAQEGINQVNVTKDDAASQTSFTLRERIIPVRVIDTPTTAEQYALSTLIRTKQPVPLDSIQIYPIETHELFGGFTIGDVVSLQVDFDFVQIARREIRIVGAVVTVEQTGVERIYYSLQEPQYG